MSASEAPSPSEACCTSKATSAVNEEDEEAFYEAHREALLAKLRTGAQQLQSRCDGGVGLLNQGATCYMNSLLQALFYTPEFRAAIYKFQHQATDHGDAKRCIPFQLQRLFAELQLSHAQAVSTKDLTAAFGFSCRETSTQHDVQELCRVLFDALSKSASTIAEEINRLYLGQMVHYIRSREEHDGQLYENRTPEGFLDLQVHIQGCKTLEEALRKLTEPDVLDGDNQWFCEKLDKKIDALKGVQVEKLPQILCLQLMRFVFDLTTMNRRKLTDEIAVPLSTDLGFLVGNEAEPCRYELMAVCLHSGTAHGGHYHAFIREPHGGTWRDANDSQVRRLTAVQTKGLFSNHSENGTAGCKLYSSDAYFLIYRHVDCRASEPREDEVPEPHRGEILAENEEFKVLRRAYEVHRQLLELKIFAPSAVGESLRRHAVRQLGDLLEDAATNAEEAQHVVVSVPGERSVSSVLAKALKAFSQQASNGDKEWEWAQDLNGSSTQRARLRKYEYWSGEPGAPLDESSSSSIEKQVGGRSISGQVSLLLELCSADGEFADWQDGWSRTVVCRWDEQKKLPSVAQGDVLALRLPPEKPTPTEDETTKKPQADPEELQPSNSTSNPDEGISSFVPGEPYDLFASEPKPPKQGVRDVSPLVGSVRKAVAAAWQVEDNSTLALVVFSGREAGTVLRDNHVTLTQCGISSGDVLCVEIAPPDRDLQSLELYTLRKNTAQLHFNHPDRPDFPEEFKLSILKSATLEELKVEIAKVIQMNAGELHLCRGPRTPQLKDEQKTLQQVGVSESSSVFVGLGAPCAPGESMLRVALYTYEKGNHKVRDAFSFAVGGSEKVKWAREALLGPLVRWAEEVAEKEGTHPFSIDGLTWKKLRLRDGQAGKQYALLRDDRALRSALLGFGDGRQVAVQILDAEEELSADDILISVRPWRVAEGRLHAASEVVVHKNQTLCELREVLTSRFKGLLQDPQTKSDNGETVGEDSLEVVALPSVGPPLTVKRCESLKWAESRLNATDPKAVVKAISDLKEVRDGVTIVVRSKLSASAGIPVSVPAFPAGKGASKGPKRAPAPESGAKKASVSVAVPPASRERGLVIEVVHPEKAAETAKEVGQ